MVSRFKSLSKYVILLVIFVLIILFFFILLVKKKQYTSIENGKKVKVYTKEEMQARYSDFDSLLKELGYNIELINHNSFSDEDINVCIYYDVGAGEKRWELVKLMCQKNGDWHNLPISQEVKDKYEKTGLLPNEEFDRIEFWEYEEFEPRYDPYYLGGFGSGNPRFKIWNGSIEKGVEFTLNEIKPCGGILTIDEINILSKEESQKLLEERKKAYYTIPQYELNEENWERCTQWLQYATIENTSREPHEGFVAKTKKYKTKYPRFLDVFIHYSPQDYNEIELVEISDYKDLTAKYRVSSVLEGKVREYEVKFILDDKLYIDGVDIELLTEQKGQPGHDVYRRLLYKNSDIVGLNISKELRTKYQEYGSYNEDIDLINIDIPVIYKIINNDWNEQIQQFTLNDGTIAFYYLKIIYNDKETYKNDEKVEDIICYKLPYENMTIDKVLDLYLTNK